MQFSGRVTLDKVSIKFQSLETLIQELKENNRLELFLDEVDKLTGRRR